jgi:hypothetical protein
VSVGAAVQVAAHALLALHHLFSIEACEENSQHALGALMLQHLLLLCLLSVMQVTMRACQT